MITNIKEGIPETWDGFVSKMLEPRGLKPNGDNKRLGDFYIHKLAVMRGDPNADQQLNEWGNRVENEDPDFFQRCGPVISIITSTTEPPSVREKKDAMTRRSRGRG